MLVDIDILPVGYLHFLSLVIACIAYHAVPNSRRNLQLPAGFSKPISSKNADLRAMRIPGRLGTAAINLR